MQVKLSWGEQFLNWMYNHTKLYIRGEQKRKDYLQKLELEVELCKSLQPLFDSFKQEAYTEGYLAALKEWAWWKDGTERVGCGVYSLEQAKKMFLERK